MCKNLNASDIRCELWLAVQGYSQTLGYPGAPARTGQCAGLHHHAPVGVTDATVGAAAICGLPATGPAARAVSISGTMPLDTNWFCPCNVPVDSRKPPACPSLRINR
jgi:hypothetical protein